MELLKISEPVMIMWRLEHSVIVRSLIHAVPGRAEDFEDEASDNNNEPIVCPTVRYLLGCT